MTAIAALCLYNGSTDKACILNLTRCVKVECQKSIYADHVCFNERYTQYLVKCIEKEKK